MFCSSIIEDLLLFFRARLDGDDENYGMEDEEYEGDEKRGITYEVSQMSRIFVV